MGTEGKIRGAGGKICKKFKLLEIPNQIFRYYGAIFKTYAATTQPTSQLQ